MKKNEEDLMSNPAAFLSKWVDLLIYKYYLLSSNFLFKIQDTFKIFAYAFGCCTSLFQKFFLQTCGNKAPDPRPLKS